MKSLLKIVFFFLLITSFTAPVVNSSLIIRNFQDQLLSSEFDYPNNEQRIDVIWSLDHSIQLDINTFQLDGQNGDFLLVSELPLMYEEYLNGTVLTGEIFNKVFMSSQALLLSWTVNETIQALSEHGTFIYFHAEPRPRTNGVQAMTIAGFDINLFDLGM